MRSLPGGGNFDLDGGGNFGGGNFGESRTTWMGRTGSRAGRERVRASINLDISSIPDGRDGTVGGGGGYGGSIASPCSPEPALSEVTLSQPVEHSNDKELTLEVDSIGGGIRPPILSRERTDLSPFPVHERTNLPLPISWLWYTSRELSREHGRSDSRDKNLVCREWYGLLKRNERHSGNVAAHSVLLLVAVFCAALARL